MLLPDCKKWWLMSKIFKKCEALYKAKLSKPFGNTKRNFGTVLEE